MARQEDLKRVDLKVSVNCCEGCKRKVLKALRIKGVLQTEAHPSLPKITVIGNVDTSVLIKKLAKIGKTAEVLLPEVEPQKQQTEEKKPEGGEETVEKGSKNEKQQAESCSDTKKSDGNDREQSSDIETMCSSIPTVITAATNIPHMNYYAMNPSMLQNYANLMAAQSSVCYHPMESAVMPMMRCYNMNAYTVVPPLQHQHDQHNYYNHELPPYQPPPMQSQTTNFADYFNEDNTTGCFVM